MLLLEDEDVCFALGVDSEGMCLRHPNIRIALTNSNANDKGNHIDFHVCRICQSELGTWLWPACYSSVDCWLDQ